MEMAALRLLNLTTAAAPQRLWPLSHRLWQLPLLHLFHPSSFTFTEVSKAREHGKYSPMRTPSSSFLSVPT
jgi:hypothetical protein